MRVAFGLIGLVLSLLAWGGQIIAWMNPVLAQRLSLSGDAAHEDAGFSADGRGEARWDAFTLWVMPVAAILWMIEAPRWPEAALIGGAIYLYFGGRGILSRRALLDAGVPIGTRADVRSAMIMLAVWGLLGAIAVTLALAA